MLLKLVFLRATDVPSVYPFLFFNLTVEMKQIYSENDRSRRYSWLHATWDTFATTCVSLPQNRYLTGTNCGCGSVTGCATALRCESASNMPSIANDVISDQPPWLTNGSVIPVI